MISGDCQYIPRAISKAESFATINRTGQRPGQCLSVAPGFHRYRYINRLAIPRATDIFSRSARNLAFNAAERLSLARFRNSR